MRFLRYLIQADLYQYAGTFMFNQLVKPGLFSDYDLSYECEEKTVQLGDKFDIMRPIIVTDPAEDIAFRAGVLNCLEKGSLLFCT